MAGYCLVPNVFLSFDWLSLWWERYGSGSSLLLLFAPGPGGDPVALAPLCLRRRVILGVPVRAVEFVGSGEVTPDHLGFICPPYLRAEFCLAVFDYLKNNRSAWDVIRLTDMCQDDELAAAAEALDSLTRPAYFRKGVCPYIRLASSWEEYARTLTSKRRQRIGKYERDLKARHRIGFSLCREREGLLPAMRALRELRAQRMRGKLAPRAATAEDSFWEFQEEVAKRALDRGNLFLSTLRVDGEIAACSYGIGTAGRVCLYLMGSDLRFSNLSIGLVNLVYLIREAISLGMGEIDLLRGNEEYKFYFTGQARPNTELVVWNRNSRAALVNAVDMPVSFMKRTVKMLIGRAGSGHI